MTRPPERVWRSGRLVGWDQLQVVLLDRSVVGPAAGTEVLVPGRSPAVLVATVTGPVAGWVEGTCSVVGATKAFVGVAGGGAEVGAAVAVLGRAGGGLVLGQSSEGLRLITGCWRNLGGDSQTWTGTQITGSDRDLVCSLARLRLRGRGRRTHHAVRVVGDDGAAAGVDVELVPVQVVPQVPQSAGAGPGIGRQVQVRHLLLLAEPIIRHHLDLSVQQVQEAGGHAPNSPKEPERARKSPTWFFSR